MMMIDDDEDYYNDNDDDPCRPRNDRDDPNRSDPNIFPWLSRRGMNIGQVMMIVMVMMIIMIMMNIGQFSKLVEGRVPPHTPDQLDHRVSEMEL